GTSGPGRPGQKPVRRDLIRSRSSLGSRIASGSRRWRALLAGDPPDDLVDQAVFLGLGGGQVAVALGVLGDPLDRLAGVPGEDLVDHLLTPDDLLGLDLDVGDLTADLAIRLVDHD